MLDGGICFGCDGNIVHELGESFPCPACSFDILYMSINCVSYSYAAI